MPITVKYPFYPNKASATGQRTWKDAEFKFTIVSVEEMEETAGCGIEYLRLQGKQIRALILLACYGLRWTEPDMNPARARKLLTRFVDADGDVVALTKALVKALNESGVYGSPDSNKEEIAAGEDAAEKVDPDDDEGDDPNPPAPTAH